mmetsp:Transcript_11078/g.17926  ORF Transcript_11078/g.17926 Transcript_11078/m.17926 type:complete len:349 (-) Transcript_11078:68-1114(-)
MNERNPVIRQPTCDCISNKKQEGLSLVLCIRIFDTQRIERIPRILIVHAQSHPLRHNLLLALHDGTSAVFRELIVHLHRHWIDVTEESRGILLRPNVYIGIPEPGRSPHLRHVAVHDDRGHAVPRLEVQAVAVPIAVWHVPIGRLVVRTPSEVLDGHEVLLPVLPNIKRQHVVDVVVHASGQSRDEVSLLLLLPMHLDPRLLRLPRFAELAPPAPVRDRGIVQERRGRLLHGPALVVRQEVLDGVDAGSGPVDHDAHLHPTTEFASAFPVLGPLGLRGVEALVGAGVVLDQCRHVLADGGLEGDLLVGAFDFDGDALLDAFGEILQDVDGAFRVGGEVRFGSGLAIVE